MKKENINRQSRNFSHGNDSLHYLRKADKNKDGKYGYLYIHRWATGYEQLVFDEHADAKSWWIEEVKRLEKATA